MHRWRIILFYNKTNNTCACNLKHFDGRKFNAKCVEYNLYVLVVSNGKTNIHSYSYVYVQMERERVSEWASEWKRVCCVRTLYKFKLNDVYILLFVHSQTHMCVQQKRQNIHTTIPLDMCLAIQIKWHCNCSFVDSFQCVCMLFIKYIFFLTPLAFLFHSFHSQCAIVSQRVQFCKQINSFSVAAAVFVVAVFFDCCHSHLCVCVFKSYIRSLHLKQKQRKSIVIWIKSESSLDRIFHCR